MIGAEIAGGATGSIRPSSDHKLRSAEGLDFATFEGDLRASGFR